MRDVADAYIDDIIVGTRVEPGEDPITKHDGDLRRVLDILGADNLVCSGPKCRLFVKEIKFCGHILGGGMRRPAPGNLMAIEKWEVPQTISALRAFLGFTNYYAGYVHGYADVVARLQDKLCVSREDGKKVVRKRFLGMTKTSTLLMKSNAVCALD